MNFNFEDLVKRSWHIAWKNRALWFFGIFISAGVEGFVARDFDYESIRQKAMIMAELPKTVLLVIAGFFILITLLFFIISVISQGAMIKGIDNSVTGMQNKFRQLWKFGVSKFWRVLGLEVILGLMALVFLAPVLVIGFFNVAWIEIIILVWILILLVLLIIFGNFFYYVFAYAVVEDKKIGSAIAAGWNLFKNNIKISILVSLLLIGFSIAFALFIMIASVILLVPFLLLGILMGLWLEFIGALIAAIVGGFMIFAFTVLAKGVFNAFSYGMPLLTYMQLSGRNVLAEKKVSK